MNRKYSFCAEGFESHSAPPVIVSRESRIVSTGPDFPPTRARLDGDVRPRADDTAESWLAIPRMFRALTDLPSPWEEMFGPLRSGTTDPLVVVGQVGQSLDGRIA